MSFQIFKTIHLHSYLLFSPGSQDKMANRRKALKSLDFQCFSFLPKFQIRAEYRGGE